MTCFLSFRGFAPQLSRALEANYGSIVRVIRVQNKTWLTKLETSAINWLMLQIHFTLDRLGEEAITLIHLFIKEIV